MVQTAGELVDEAIVEEHVGYAEREGIMRFVMEETAQ